MRRSGRGQGRSLPVCCRSVAADGIHRRFNEAAAGFGQHSKQCGEVYGFRRRGCPARQSGSGEKENAVVRFVIRDTGVGISPEFLPHLFEPFFTGVDGNDRGVWRQRIGTGDLQKCCRSDGRAHQRAFRKRKKGRNLSSRSNWVLFPPRQKSAAGIRLMPLQ